MTYGEYRDNELLIEQLEKEIYIAIEARNSAEESFRESEGGKLFGAIGEMDDIGAIEHLNNVLAAVRQGAAHS